MILPPQIRSPLPRHLRQAPEQPPSWRSLLVGLGAFVGAVLAFIVIVAGLAS